MNRQKLVCAINVWLAAMAAGLAVLAWLQMLNPYLILASVFLLGVGFAFNAPAWTSIVSQVVSDGEFPSAATLNGLQLNISGIIGPVLAGFLIPLAGANFAFAQIARLGHLPKSDPASARAWLYGKLLVALLTEKLIAHAKTISPWGYKLQSTSPLQSLA